MCPSWALWLNTRECLDYFHVFYIPLSILDSSRPDILYLSQAADSCASISYHFFISFFSHNKTISAPPLCAGVHITCRHLFCDNDSLAVHHYVLKWQRVSGLYFIMWKIIGSIFINNIHGDFVLMSQSTVYLLSATDSRCWIKRETLNLTNQGFLHRNIKLESRRAVKRHITWS